MTNNNVFSLDPVKMSNQNHSPQPQSQNRAQSLSKDSRTSLLTQQKQPLNITVNYPNESKNIVNLSAMISPLSRCAQIIQQKQLNQKIQRNTHQFQEDIQSQKIHTKNSTSVGELMSMKSDAINYSNIINRILRKESYSISSPDGRATEKFKQALNEKLNNLQQDNSKSYGIDSSDKKLVILYIFVKKFRTNLQFPSYSAQMLSFFQILHRNHESNFHLILKNNYIDFKLLFLILQLQLDLYEKLIQHQLFLQAKRANFKF